MSTTLSPDASVQVTPSPLPPAGANGVGDGFAITQITYAELNIGLMVTSIALVTSLSNTYLASRLLFRQRGTGALLCLATSVVGIIVSSSDTAHYFFFDAPCSPQQIVGLLGTFTIFTLIHSLLLWKARRAFANITNMKVGRAWMLVGILLIVLRSIPWIYYIATLSTNIAAALTPIGVCASLQYTEPFLAIVAMELVVFLFLGLRFYLSIRAISRHSLISMYGAMVRHELSGTGFLLLLGPILLLLTLIPSGGGLYTAIPSYFLWVIASKLCLEDLTNRYRIDADTKSGGTCGTGRITQISAPTRSVRERPSHEKHAVYNPHVAPSP